MREGEVVVCGLAWGEQAGVEELPGKGEAGEHGLHYVCAVEAVHAICADDGGLAGADLEGVAGDGRGDCGGDGAGNGSGCRNAAEVAAGPDAGLKLVE